MLADHPAVLGLGQPIVVGMARPGFGEFGGQFVEQLGHLAIDVLRAVVGMKAQNADCLLYTSRCV